MGYRQLIIARKDLNMSPGKLAAQVSHASMAFLTAQIRQTAKKVWNYYTAPTMKKDLITGEISPQLFRHPDLAKFADEARAKGLSTFTYRPVNADNPYGRMERCENEYDKYRSTIDIPRDVYEQWIQGSFTKTICEARSRDHLLTAIKIAHSLDLIEENYDYFLIKDNCLTELEPEETDENGVGRTLTCIGFRPLPDEIVWKISKKYQLYK